MQLPDITGGRAFRFHRGPMVPLIIITEPFAVKGEPACLGIVSNFFRNRNRDFPGHKSQIDEVFQFAFFPQPNVP